MYELKHSSRWRWVPRSTLAVGGAATLLVLVGFTTVAPTVQDTASTFRASVAWQTWALSAMSLGLAAALLTAGTMADQIGRRRTLRIGLTALAATTAVSAAAPSMGVFVAARIAQGVAGAAVLAAALALIGHAYPAGRARVRATGIWGATLGAGIAVGPLVSSVLARSGDWRLAYWLEAVLLTVVAVWAGALTESSSTQRRRADVAGAATFAAGMAALVAALVTGRQGWSAASTMVLLVTALACIAAFVAIQARRAEPMFDLHLLRRPSFLNSVLGALVVGLTTIALMSYSASFFERALGLSALASSALLTGWSATSAVIAWHAHRLPTRLTTRHRLVFGLAVCALGLWLVRLSPDGGWDALLPGLIVTGIGSGLTNAALGQLAVASAPQGRPGLGSGANNTARYLGGAAGIAIVVAVAVPSSVQPSTQQLVAGWNAAAAVCAGLCALGIVAALLLRDATPDGADRSDPTGFGAVLTGAHRPPAHRGR
jgi:MFS family permease